MIFVVCYYYKNKKIILTFSNNFFKTVTIRVFNSFDSQRAQNFVRPDLGQNCLQKSPAVDKHCHYSLVRKDSCTDKLSMQIFIEHNTYEP